MAKITVILPVYNMAEYLDQTLESWTKQTLHDIEILCIDDASTDGSFELLQQWAQRDSRIVCHRFEENKSAWAARKWGIAHATAEYILFGDADDTIAPEACEELYAEMEKAPVDILHFGANIINVNHLPEERIHSMERFVSPYEGRLYGKDIFTACFNKKLYQFSLWNKMFRREVCKKAIEGTPDWFLPKAQDKLLYWAIALHANSYRGIPRKRYYNYYFGRGGTGFSTLNLRQFARYCTMADTAAAMHEYLIASGKGEEYSAIDQQNRQNLFGDCFTRFQREVSEGDKAAAFDILIQKWGRVEVISALAKAEWDNRYAVAKYLRGAEALRCRKTAPKVIGTYYHSCRNGGAQRVMCNLALLLASMGYSLVIFTDEAPTKEDYALPASAQRVVLPSFREIRGDNYALRAKALEKALQEHHVDIMLYHAWVVNLMLWDELICKTNGVGFIGHCHNIFALLFARPREAVENAVAPYMLADCVVTLSQTDQYFWKHFNANTHVTVNPISEEYRRWKPSESLDKKNILWMGRLSGEKQPYDALYIMERVVKAVPDAHLHIVGSNPSEKYMEAFRDTIKRMGLEPYVTMHGFQKDVEAYYCQSSLFLMTSQYEGYPLTLQESKLAGLPCVMYELPYLTLCEGSRGIIPVGQNNVGAAAEAVIDLMTDHEKRHRYSKDARAHIEEVFAFDFVGKWQEILSSVYAQEPAARADGAAGDISESSQLMLKTILHFQANGIKQAQNADPTTAKKFRFLDKIQGGIQCWMDHGLIYTIKLAFHKMKVWIRDRCK